MTFCITNESRKLGMDATATLINIRTTTTINKTDLPSFRII